MRRIMAVYDMDPFYAERFAAFANQREAVPFMVVAFSSMECLKQYSGQHHIDLLLVSDEINLEIYRKLPIGQVVLLNEGEFSGLETEVPTVYKYQSAELVLREVMACYQVSTTMPMAVQAGSNCKFVGIYSPVNRCGKTSFALAYAQMAAREERTLYVNLEDCSGFSQLLKQEGRGDLADILYHFKQHQLDRIRLCSVVHSLGELDYIPPVRYPEDMGQTGARELTEILMHIGSLGEYRMVVIDIGQLGKMAAELLSICEVIYMPVLDNVIASAKITEFEEYLQVSGQGGVASKITRLRLPAITVPASGPAWQAQLLWGEMGDFVRQLLNGSPSGLSN